MEVQLPIHVQSPASTNTDHSMYSHCGSGRDIQISRACSWVVMKKSDWWWINSHRLPILGMKNSAPKNWRRGPHPGRRNLEDEDVLDDPLGGTLERPAPLLFLSLSFPTYAQLPASKICLLAYTLLLKASLLCFSPSLSLLVIIIITYCA